MAERAELKTTDGVTIAGNYYSAAGMRGVLLLHMMPATKESWDSLAIQLQRAGFAVLAIDLRGHGESGGGPNGYKSFSDAQRQASILDVEVAAEFLKSKGIGELYLGGASIGANLALWYAAEHTDVRAAFLLSPGLDYRGIKTESFASSLKPDQAVYFVADENDPPAGGAGADVSAAQMSRRLYSLTSAKKEITIYKGSGHGTDMFASHPELEDELASWLSKQ